MKNLYFFAYFPSYLTIVEVSQMYYNKKILDILERTIKLCMTDGH